jgi:hypothetical protein
MEFLLLAREWDGPANYLHNFRSRLSTHAFDEQDSVTFAALHTRQHTAKRVREFTRFEYNIDSPLARAQGYKRIVFHSPFSRVKRKRLCRRFSPLIQNSICSG